jgi:hypothetical protein
LREFEERKRTSEAILLDASWIFPDLDQRRDHGPHEPEAVDSIPPIDIIIPPNAFPSIYRQWRIQTAIHQVRLSVNFETLFADSPPIRK